MLKLNEIHCSKVWGYENWIASTHKNGLQKEFLDYAGGPYPLLVKVIQANDSLSVQVHPDDNAAVQLEGPGNVGKTECWYVLDAAPDAKIVYGLDGKISVEQLSAAIDESRLESFLNFVQVKKGDFIFIPSGTVHAIGSGLRLLEVQQSCDLTYRLYDWGRPRELHVQKALASIKNGGLSKVAPFSGEFSCQYFSLERINVSGGYSGINLGKEKNPASVILYFVLEGEGRVRSCPKGESPAPGSSIEFKSEDIIALSAGEKITFMSEGASLMKIAAR